MNEINVHHHRHFKFRDLFIAIKEFNEMNI